MSETVITILTLVGVGAVAYAAIWTAKKFKISQKEIEFASLMVDLMIYLFKYSEIEVKNRALIEKVLERTQQVVEIVEESSDLESYELKQYIFAETKEILEEEGIAVNEEVLTLIREIVDFLV